MRNIKETITICNSITTNGIDHISKIHIEDIASITLGILEKINDFIEEYDMSDVCYKEEYLTRDHMAHDAAIETFVNILDELEDYFVD